MSQRDEEARGKKKNKGSNLFLDFFEGGVAELEGLENFLFNRCELQRVHHLFNIWKRVSIKALFQEEPRKHDRKDRESLVAWEEKGMSQRVILSALNKSFLEFLLLQTDLRFILLSFS